MSVKQTTDQSVAEAYLSLLANRGVDYIFGNAGTDFPPIIEAYSKAKFSNQRFPTPIVVPHENVAIAMAHGYYMATGRMQAVMVHVGLGTANAINGIINAARQNVPVLFVAGRTPIAEQGLPGSRNNYINWAQEMFDQAQMVREFVKWDYELRHAIQLETVVDRAIALANSDPKGPVYLTLPREVLASSMNNYPLAATRTVAAATTAHSDPAVLGQVAEWLSKSKRPLLITSNGGRDEAGFEAIAKLAEDLAVPVVQYRPRYLCLSTEHPMHCGFDPTALLKDSDLVLVVDSDVPWLPEQVKLPSGCRVVHIGLDPLFARYPVRGFQADVALNAEVAATLRDLTWHARDKTNGELLAQRRKRVLSARSAQTGLRGNGARTPPASMTPAWISACIDMVKDDDTILINEYPLVLEEMRLTKSGSYFSHSPAGGLGWGMGAALGYKLARPEITPIVAIGDGTYMFGNPTPTHFVGRASDLPALYVIFNNARWAAVHRATLSMYPTGFASRDNQPPFSCLEPSPDYEKLVEASGGYGVKVEDPAALPAALRQALKVVREERRQAVLNVICEPIYVRTS